MSKEPLAVIHFEDDEKEEEDEGGKIGLEEVVGSWGSSARGLKLKSC